MVGLSRQTWADLRVVAYALLILIGLFVAGAGAASWLDCHGARSCPSGGCSGSELMQACQGGQEFALDATLVGVPLMFAALGVAVWSLRREGRLSGRPAV